MTHSQSSPSRFETSREELHRALCEYNQLREELEETPVDDPELIIIGSKIPKVLRDLSEAAGKHAVVMEHKMDSIYMNELIDRDD